MNQLVQNLHLQQLCDCHHHVQNLLFLLQIALESWSTQSLNDHSAKGMKQQIIVNVESQILDHYHYF